MFRLKQLAHKVNQIVIMPSDAIGSLCYVYCKWKYFMIIAKRQDLVFLEQTTKSRNDSEIRSFVILVPSTTNFPKRFSL